MNDGTGQIAPDDDSTASYTRHGHTSDAQDPHGIAVERADAKRALAESRRQIHALSRQVTGLEEANARLKQVVQDLTQREAQARMNACHDELTGLPNRRELNDRLRQAMAQGARRKRQIALLLLDLDDFKTINDELGHGRGDQVLQLVAARLLRATRDADTACRYGGDEFVILVPEIDDPRMADIVVSKLRASLSEPYEIDGFEIRMTASAGHAIYPIDGDSCDALMATADHALYRAKAAHRKVSIANRAVETAAPHVVHAPALREP